ncbi:MAG: HD domain-containing protein [Candidatus Edwardsbacteria bacterium]
MIKPKDFIKIFPELEEISDNGLKEGVIKIWLLAIKRGKWKSLENIPFTLLIPTKISLIEHTRRVTRMAMAIVRERKDLNLDLIIAGGLTHDVGKLLEYERKEGKVIKSKFGSMMRHPVSGAALALKVGLPKEVAHIIAAHSEEGEKVKRIPEAIAIHHCDFIDFEIEKNQIETRHERWR